jgi:hypothetical protein
MPRRLRALVLDVGPLRRHREFRLLYTGQAVSFAGSMITYVAIPFQVFELTRSTFVVGLLGLAELAPLLVTALIGGALADAHDRRRLVLIADATMLVLALALVGNALLAAPQVWVLFVVASGMTAVGGLQRPALDSMVPRLVPREELPAASALESFRHNAGQIAGPAVGGILIAGAGLGATYAVDAATFLVSLVALARMRAVPPPADTAPPRRARIAEGWRYARRPQDLMGTYLVDINAMLFAMPIGRRERGARRRRDRRLRPRRPAAARARLPGDRRRGRHVLRNLPFDDVEPDDPGRAARPARRDVLDRACTRQCVALTPERVDRRRCQGRRGWHSAPARATPEDAGSGGENAFCVSA